MRVYLTHTPDALANYYGERALEGLRSICEVRLNDTDRDLDARAVIEKAAGCELIVSYRNTPAPAEIFQNMPDLAVWLRCAVDIRNIDVAAASANGVLVTQASPGFTESVSELVVGMMIDLARGVSGYAAAYHGGSEPVSASGTQLAGRQLGILGYGTIGRYLAQLGLALGMKVVVSDPFATVTDDRIVQSDMGELLGTSDFTVCLVVANEETENLIDENAFRAMKPGAFFVNVSRGNLVNEPALETAHRSGHLAGAALDVGRAPDQMPSPGLARLPNVIATPHIGGLTPDAIEAQSLETVEQVRALASGKLPHGAVNAAAATRLDRLGIAVPAN
ncbi:MAG TPA: NAD(P)-dependent oxidoreductase [Afifellaceae bacterium]|nr:NAD(P)-dependent oxidoreductase [Afifellaceae bacterium]